MPLLFAWLGYTGIAPLHPAAYGVVSAPAQ